MNIQTCTRCGHLFNYCGCQAKALICNTCDPIQDAGPRVERADFDVSSFLAKGQTPPRQDQWAIVGGNCHRTIEQIQFWTMKIVELKASGSMYKIKLTLADVNRMLGNLQSAINTRNYCFPGVSEAEAAVALAMNSGF